MSDYNPLQPKIYDSAEDRQKRFEELAINLLGMKVDGKHIVCREIHEMIDIYMQAENALHAAVSEKS